MVYFCAFIRSETFCKNARELGVGRGEFHAGVNGLSSPSMKTLSGGLEKKALIPIMVACSCM